MTKAILPENYKRVLKLIKIGAENATTGAEIAVALKLDIRTVQTIVSRLIVFYGVPIVAQRDSYNSGYYIPANKGELLEGVKAFYKQTQEEQKRLTALMNADLENWKGLISDDSTE